MSIPNEKFEVPVYVPDSWQEKGPPSLVPADVRMPEGGLERRYLMRWESMPETAEAFTVAEIRELVEVARFWLLWEDLGCPDGMIEALREGMKRAKGDG